MLDNVRQNSLTAKTAYMAKQYEYYMSIEKDPAFQIDSYSWINGSEKPFRNTGIPVGSEIEIVFGGGNMVPVSRFIGATASDSLFTEIVLSVREVKNRWFKVLISYHFKNANCPKIVPVGGNTGGEVFYYVELYSTDVSVRQYS